MVQPRHAGAAFRETCARAREDESVEGGGESDCVSLGGACVGAAVF